MRLVIQKQQNVHRSLDSDQVSDTECHGSTVLHLDSVPLGEVPPPALRDCFGRDELIEKVVTLAENLEPVALIGAGGIGKTSIALTVLHHNRVEERFGENRRFIRCDQFPASRPHFLARLSKVIGAGVENPEDLTPLRFLLSSKEMLIILDNAESILDPKGASAKEIYSVVDELSKFKKVCLCITSRITTVPPRCKRLEIPTLSIEAARDIFYGIYDDHGRSNTTDDLLRRLDFHALSITLLATTASHNAWDHNRLAKEWGAQRAQVLQTDYNESLAATIELSLASPTFHSLGCNARDLLEVVAFFPQGVDEENLDWLFPEIPNRRNFFDKFCILSLTHRSNGFITMLAPIRDHLSPQDPRSSPLLCTTRGHYFFRLSVDVDPDRPGFKEAQWIVSEDVNIEHLLDVFTSLEQDPDDNWDACYHFMGHLYWFKPRRTVLGPKIEALSDDHHSQPKCLFRLSWLAWQAGNHTERKRLLTHTLELERRRGDDFRIAQTLRHLSGTNGALGLHGEGKQQAEEALHIAEMIGDIGEQTRCLTYLAWLLLDGKQLDAAEDTASRAINLASEKGQAHVACHLHRILGGIYRTKGKKKQAFRHFETALGIASPFNWHPILFWVHHSLAQLFHDEKEFDDANAHIERAKSHAINAYDEYKLGHATEAQAGFWYEQGRLEVAKLEASRALKIYQRVGATKEAGCCRDLFQMIERAMESRSSSIQG